MGGNSPYRPNKFSSNLDLNAQDSVVNAASPIPSFKRDENTATIGSVSGNQQNLISKRNMINDDFLDKMISQDNAQMQNQRASGPIISQMVSKPAAIGGGSLPNGDYNSSFRGTFYQNGQ